MGCNLRYHDALIDLRNLIQTNKLGRVYDFDISVGSYLPDWRPWQDYTQSYSAKEELGGGVVLDLIHEIDYAYWLFGEFTKSKSFVGKISDLKINTEDIAKIILQTANQCMGTISLNYYRRIPERKIAANFEYGSILLDLIKSQFTIYYADDHCEVKNYQIDRNHMYERQMKYFIESVIHKKETQNNILEGLKVLEYALNIKQGKDII
jgi:predicted dehydrogenase